MAIIDSSIWKNARGAFDDIIFVTRHGQTYTRRRPKEYHDRNSPKQKKVRAAFTISNDLLDPLATYVRYMYGETGQNYRNALMSRIEKHAMVWHDNKWEVLYDKIILSDGYLDVVEDLTLSSNKKHKLQITWKDNSDNNHAKSDDEMIIICYSPESKRKKVVEASKRNIKRNMD